MGDWRTQTVDEIAAPTKSALATGPFGSAIGSKTFRDLGVPVIRGGNLSSSTGTRLVDQGLAYVDEELANRFKRSIARRGDLVFTCWGTTNQIGIIDKRAKFDEYIVSNKQMKLTPDSTTILSLFLYYFFSSPAGQRKIADQAIGSSVPGFNLTGLKSIVVPVPPLAEQAAIVEVLGALDDKIELNRRMSGTLEAMARAIFKDWFVDFGPTRAKAEGRDPYLAPEIWDLFPDALDDDDKPVGWVQGELADLFLLQRGFDLPKSKRTPGRYPVMAASGINGSHDEFMVRGPGVTTGRSGVIGNVFFTHDDFWPLNTSLWIKEYRISSPQHAYYLIQTLDFGAFNSGSAVPTLNRNHVHSLPQTLPPIELVGAFDGMVVPLLQRQRANEREEASLSQTRDLLLPKLMSGEIRLKDAEKAFEAVA